MRKGRKHEKKTINEKKNENESENISSYVRESNPDFNNSVQNLENLGPKY